jgi:exonuclease III
MQMSISEVFTHKTLFLRVLARQADLLIIQEIQTSNTFLKTNIYVLHYISICRQNKIKVSFYRGKTFKVRKPTLYSTAILNF